MLAAFPSQLSAFRPSVSSRWGNLLRSALIALTCGVCTFHAPAALASTTTSTSLSITSSGLSTPSVAAGAVVTLTAAVTANSAPLTTGLVNFCDATAATCLDAHRLGSAQLTSAGVATIKFRPGIGMHHYKAVFVGTNSALTSASPASALTVTGSNSTTSLAVVGSPGSYQLTATVTGLSAPTNPTGAVAFNDTTNGNATLSSPSLTPGTVNFGFTNI